MENRENDIDILIKSGEKFYNDLKKENSRYKSWEYCYAIFNRAHTNNDVDIDLLCLHLGFYLASWGMYRGSSFLLERDYKVHKEVIEEILRPCYDALWGIKCDELLKDDNLNKLMELNKIIKEKYDNIRKKANIGKLPKSDLSQILTTKVLLGTLGCTPAFDSNFVRAIRSRKIASGNFNYNSIKALANYYKDHKELEDFRKKLKTDIEYPQMKVLDMCLWQTEKKD